VEPVLVVGLGNPGDEYAPTRHNVGFRVVDTLTGMLESTPVRSKGEYALRTARSEGALLLLMKPLTYMNNSGAAVAAVIERYGLASERMLVVVDDFALPLGTLRLRLGGSDGGHNGLFSIALALQSTDFPRLRCGIGRAAMPPKSRMADFVLSPFSPDEEVLAREMVLAASGRVREFAAEAARKSSL
jgi:PTH1 family peptidyl-tRNA hydrolase